jgi:hypothetical protein
MQKFRLLNCSTTQVDLKIERSNTTTTTTNNNNIDNNNDNVISYGSQQVTEVFHIIIQEFIKYFNLHVTVPFRKERKLET